MNIAILGESLADEAAVGILVEAIVGTRITREGVRNYRAPGCAALPRILPPVLRTLYFSSDAVGLVVVLDSNGTAVHKDKEGVSGVCDPRCRLCELREIAQRELSRLTKRPERVPLRFAAGLAVPAIEAWLLLARESGINEIVWQSARNEKPPREAYSRRELKIRVYGTDAPPIELETKKMVEHMGHVAKDLNKLVTFFPGGAGPLVRDIRSWRE